MFNWKVDETFYNEVFSVPYIRIGKQFMVTKLAYGKTGLEIRLSDNLDVIVIEPKYIHGLADPKSELRKALKAPVLSPPLRDFVKPSDSIGIVFNDITRPTPYGIIMPVILDELREVSEDNITLFTALGTHRKNSDRELREMLGDGIFKRYRIVQNDAFDKSTQVLLGVSSRGQEIWINREFCECDVKIITGFIEPHFFAGFSGGGKAIMPGMAGLQNIMDNHNAEMIDDAKSTWGITKGNPIWEEIHEVALKVGKTFLVNVTLNKEREITGIFAGDLTAAHVHGCAFVKNVAMVTVKRPFDIVITSNSGNPLDLNLYQAVKGMSAAAQVVKYGGAIIVAADCWDGIPEHGLYGQFLREAESPRSLLERIHKHGFLQQDQWQAQIQAQVQLRADVYVRSDNLTAEQIESALLKPSARIEDTVEELLSKYGSKARICVLPEGPQTIPYIQ